MAGGGVGGGGADAGSVGGAGGRRRGGGGELRGRRGHGGNDEHGVDGVGDAVGAELVDDHQVGTVDRLCRRVDEEHVTTEGGHLGGSKDLLLVELTGEHVGEHELLEGDLVVDDVAPHGNGVDRRVRRRQHGDALGAEEVDHRLG